MRRLPAFVLLLGAVRIANADDQTPAEPPPADAQPLEETPPVEEPPPAVETGRVLGRILDGATGEGLPAATIQIKDVLVVASELDGTFVITLPVGTYDVSLWTPEYSEVS